MRIEAHQQRIVRNRAPDVDLVIRMARRNQKSSAVQLQSQYPLLGRRFRVDHADARLVERRLLCGRVVHLEDKIRAGGDQLGHALRPAVALVARRVGEQHIGLRDFGCLEAECAAHRLIAQPRRLRIAHVHDGVMHHRTVAWPDLDLLHPTIRRQAGGHDDVLVAQFSGGGYGERLRHSEHRVGSADSPSFGPDLWRRTILRHARRSAAIRPGTNRLNLFRRQPAIVREFPVVRIREPWRHFPRRHGIADRLGPRPGFFVR